MQDCLVVIIKELIDIKKAPDDPGAFYVLFKFYCFTKRMLDVEASSAIPVRL